MSVVGAVIFFVILPVAGIAFLVTLPLRFRLRQATEDLARISAAQASEAEQLRALTGRLTRAEMLLAGQPTAALPLPDEPSGALEAEPPGRPAARETVVSAEARTGRPEPQSRPVVPALPLKPRRVAAKDTGARRPETISEEIHRFERELKGEPDVLAEKAVMKQVADAAVEAEAKLPSAPAFPADAEPIDAEKLQPEEPAGIVISSDAWTGQGKPDVPPPPPEPKQPKTSLSEEEPSGAEVIASEQIAEAQPESLSPEQPLAAESEAATLIPFPKPGPAAPPLEENETPREHGDNHPEGTTPVVSSPDEEPEPAVAAMVSGGRNSAGAVARALRSGAEALSRVTEHGKSQSRNWETLIGGRWLNLIGMVLLVIGVALLTQQAFHYLDPRGKIAVGVTFALLLLLCGVLLEHRTAYRRIGSTLVGGGWALLYFDAYAASNIDQVKVIDDPATGLAAMAAVAAGMVAHSLRYRSQFITGVAFGLGYLAVLLTPVSLQSLVASAVLAAGLAIVSWSMSWQYLLGSGVIAAYSNHWFWLQNVAAAQAGGTALPLDKPSQGFWISTAILVFYWAIFAAVSLSRRMDKEMSRQLHLSVGVANAIGMLGLITLQLVQGYGGHYLGFVTGPAALGYGIVALGERRLGQRIPFLFAATLALLLYSATLPLARVDLDIDLAWLAPVLLVGAIAGLATGFRVGEMLLRAEGLTLAAASFILLSVYNLERPGASEITAVWFAAPAMAVVYQLASGWLRRRASEAMPDLGPAVWGFALAAALSIAHVLWVELPRDMVAPAWLALGILGIEAGGRREHLVLRSEGYVLAALACTALAIININPEYPFPIVTAPRYAVLLAAAAGFYFLSWRLMAGSWTLQSLERRLAWVPSAAASAIVVALAVEELPRALICAPLTLWAIVLVETGLRAGSLPIRVQGYAVLACGAAAALLVNGWPEPFGSAPDLRSWAPGAVTIAGLWWLYRRVVLQTADVLAPEAVLGAVATVAANVLLAEMLWKELPADLVGPAWIAVGVLQFKVALRLDRMLLRIEAYAVLALAFVLMLATNFGFAPPAVLTVPRWLSVGSAVAVYYAFTAWIERGTWARSAWETNLAWAPSALASALVALLAWVEFQHNMVTAALSAWSLVLVEAGLRFRRLPIRIEGYALALLSVLAALRFNGYPFPDGSPSGSESWAPLLVTVAALGWCFRRFADPRAGDHATEAWIPEAASALATVLTAQIILKEFPVDVVGLAWLALGLLLFEVSGLVRRTALRIEGYAMQGLAVAALLIVNCGSAFPLAHAAAPRWALVVPGVAGLYLSSARILSGAASVTLREVAAGWAPSLGATVLLVALAVLELDAALLAGALSLWGLVLAEAGLRSRQVIVRVQGYVLIGVATALSVAVNVSGVHVASWAAEAGGPSEWGPVLANAGVLAWLFVRLSLRPAEPATFDAAIGEWASAAASLLLALLVWKEMPSLAVSVLWCALGFGLFQLAQALHTPILRAQAHVLLGASYVRLYMANFVSLDLAGPVSLRIVTVLPVLLALFCVMEQLRTLAPDANRYGLNYRAARAESRAGPLVYSWAAFFGLVVLCRFEFGREHTVAAWSALVLVFMVLGQRLDRRDFRFQSYVLAIYSVFRAWATNLHMDGNWLGMPERISTTLPMIAVLFIVAVAVASPRAALIQAGRSRVVRLLGWLDGRAHTLFAVLASAFTAILLVYQLDTNTLSIGLALEGFCLLALGLVINDRVFRLFGLGLLLVCLIKLVGYDLRGVETIYRILSFIVLGLILLLASFGYARYRDKIEKLI